MLRVQVHAGARAFLGAGIFFSAPSDQFVGNATRRIRPTVVLLWRIASKMFALVWGERTKTGRQQERRRNRGNPACSGKRGKLGASMRAVGGERRRSRRASMHACSHESVKSKLAASHVKAASKMHTDAKHPFFPGRVGPELGSPLLPLRRSPALLPLFRGGGIA